MNRILTTHVGSLVRPPEIVADLEAIDRGEAVDAAKRDATLRSAVADIVRQQAEAGIDVVSDGELGKISWITYLYERLSGLEVRERPATETVLPPSRDRLAFPEFYAEDDSQFASQVRRIMFLGEKGLRERRDIVPSGPESWVCTGPVCYEGTALLERDLANLKAALEAVDVTDAFVPAVAPASVYWLDNAYYDSDEAFVFALAEALRTEYRAIIEAGFMLQIDDAVLAHEYDSILSQGGSVDDYRRWAQVRIDALRHALEGLPEERIRYHICWGSWHGPHAFDPPLSEIVDFMLQVPARHYAIEQANARHEHEWKLWENVELPEGKVLIPGVVTHHTNIVEHPDLVAERLTRLARIVGAERVMAGTDCGFAQGAFVRRVHPSIQWAKLRALAEGAALASAELERAAR